MTTSTGSPPSALDLDRRGRAITLAAVAAMSSLHGAITVGLILGHGFGDRDGSPVIAAAIATPILAVWVVARASRSPMPLLATLGRGCVAGVLNIGLSLFFVGVLGLPRMQLDARTLLEGPLLALFAMILGSPIGVGLGILFALALAPLVIARRRDLKAPDHLVIARTAIRCGAWMIATAVLAALLPTIETRGIVHGCAIGGVGAGVALALFGLDARRRARASIARRARGERGWAIVPASSVAIPIGDEALPFDRDVPCNLVLVREDLGDGGVYRAATTRVVWARVGEMRGAE